MVNLLEKMKFKFVGVVYLLPAALVIHAICFWARGVIDIEAMGFVLNFLVRRPFLATIFDPIQNEFGLYQAREVSYVVDFIDARAFAFLLDRHILLFVPLSGVVGLVVLCAIFVWGARKILRLDHVTTALTLSLFLSCIIVQTSTAIFYRSAKIAASLVLLAFLFCLVSALRNCETQRRVRIVSLAVLSFLGVLMSLCDRQGYFYLVSAMGIMALLWLKRIGRSSSIWRDRFRIFLALLAAVIIATLYDYVVAPRIIQSLNGYWPDAEYQHLDPAQFLDPSLLAKAWRMFHTQLSFFCGNLPFVVVCFLIAIACWASQRWSDNAPRKHREFRQAVSSDGFVATLLSVAALQLLLMVMIARHPPVYDITDHWYWYYPLTLDVIFLFGLAAWVARVDGEKSRPWKPALWLVLLILIVLNTGHYSEQRQIMIRSTDWFKHQWQHSQFFVARFEWMRNRGNGSTKTAAPDSSAVVLPPGGLDFLEEVQRRFDALRQQREPPPRQSP